MKLGFGTALTWGGILLLFVLAGSEAWGGEAPPPGTTVTISGTTTLSWSAPTANVDGSALTPLASYRIYFGRGSRQYSGNLDVNDGGATNWGFSIPLTDENDDRWFFALTATNINGHESAYSNEVIKQMTVVFEGDIPPEPPVLIDVEMSMTCTTDNVRWTCEVTWSTQ
jgi:hypothetical protein